MHTEDKIILFDIDGVLTENRQKISKGVKSYLTQLSYKHEIKFVTGNNFVQSKDILGDLPFSYDIFCNNADELRYKNGEYLWSEDSIDPLPVSLDQFLMHIQNDWAGLRFGNHIEWRTPRFLNYCPIGRHCPQEERERFNGDSIQGVYECVKRSFPHIEVVRGGQISIDIFSKGADKSRAVAKMKEWHNADCIYIGDKTSPGGNDYPVVEYCEDKESFVLTSTGPQNTVEIIKEILGES